MQMPGEGLILKLWETLTEKAIGNLLKPWQIRRVGKAILDVKRDELMILAQAEQDVEVIRRGGMCLPGYRLSERQLPFSASTEESAIEADNAVLSLGASVNSQSALAKASSAAQSDVLRREVNVARAILQAEKALEPDPQKSSGAAPSDDWIHRWSDYASSVSSEELQLLWGRVLAGEVKAPGEYSVRFLNFLHNLDRSEAQLIAQVMPLVVEDFIFKDPTDQLEKFGLTFDKLLVLQELGLISGVNGLGINKRYAARPGMPLQIFLVNHDLAIGCKVSVDLTSIEIPVYLLTNLGKQLARLGNFVADRQYLRTLGEWIKKQGFSVQIGTPVTHPDGMRTLTPLDGP